jgi:uncharacterized protein YndB with AHSA1/START domain
MMLKLTVIFDAPVERVLVLFVDPERWTRWNTAYSGEDERPFRRC